MKFLFSILFCLIFYKHSYSQQVTQEWVARYNSPENGHEDPVDVAVDSSGNVYVTGRDNIEPPGFVTVSYDRNGNFRWSKRFAGMQNLVAQPQKIGIGKNNNVYVMGYDVDILLVKYDSNGVFGWVKRFRGNVGGISSASEMVIDILGNIIITGTLWNQSDNSDIGTIKYDPDGNIIWQNSFNLSNEGGGRIDISRNGDIAVLGNISDGPGTPENFITIKYDSSGVLKWFSRYSYNFDNLYSSDIAFDILGNVIITGLRTGKPSPPPIFYYDYLTVKYYSDGSIAWVRLFDEKNNRIDWPYFIKSDYEGNVYVDGRDYPIIWGGYETTVKYNPSGSELWIKHSNEIHPKFGFGRSNDFKIDNDGNTYSIGYQNLDSNTSNKYGMYIFKRNSNEDVEWADFYSGPARIDFGIALTLFGKNILYACILSADTSGGSGDIVIIKYSQTTSINIVSSEIPERFSLSQNYPNPFNLQTKVKFSVPKNTNVKIKLFDVLGRNINVMLNETIQPGTYELSIDMTNLSTGIYFYTMETESFRDTKKLLLIR